ncbi:uncharacterized protein LOC143890568 [Tasmannia lanceolata]|uniref:uncharacterized protein LOC143890568 n=1 Tax=Tasmannia lanceolata TaxID=3420 RepID=UPI004062B7DF
MDARGSSGGIIIIWKDNIFDRLDYVINEHSISIRFRCRARGCQWLMTTVYGPSRARERRLLWPELKSIRDQWQGAWLIGGDFNTVRFPLEKNRGGSIRTSMQRLSNFIQESELVDLPLEGAKFTWTNNQESQVLSRLDRILISKEWDEEFPRICQRALPRPISDHNPVMILLTEFNGGPKPFRFDMGLCDVEAVNSKIPEWWNAAAQEGGWKGIGVCQRLKVLKTKIKEWAKHAREERDFRKGEVLSKLGHPEYKESEAILDEEDRQARVELMAEYDEIIRREEISWRQKSRVSWVNEGDKNTKFFHRMASLRRRVNAINCVSVNGSLLEEKEAIRS